MIPAHRRPAPHVLSAHLIVVSVVFGVDGGPRMRYKHLRPPGHPRSTSIFIAIIGDGRAHMLLDSPIDTSLSLHAFPERMQTMQLIVVYFFMLQINIFCLTCPILQLYNLCKVGHMSQVFDSYSSPPASRPPLT